MARPLRFGYPPIAIRAAALAGPGALQLSV